MPGESNIKYSDNHSHPFTFPGPGMKISLLRWFCFLIADVSFGGNTFAAMGIW